MTAKMAGSVPYLFGCLTPTGSDGWLRLGYVCRFGCVAACGVVAVHCRDVRLEIAEQFLQLLILCRYKDASYIRPIV